MKTQIDDSWHHMYTGIIFIIVTLPFSHPFTKFIRAVGFGLFVDECIHVYHILFHDNSMDYWSWDSLLAACIGIVIVGICYYRIEFKKA
ncbi:hypothetical protein BH09PAT2_BH09PAT2_05710 [soil metagenome]